MDQVGSLTLSDKAEVLFYLDIYQGKKFANIRKFIRSEKYTGPTKSGVKLNKDVFKKVQEALQDVPSSLSEAEEKELALISVSRIVSIRVSISYYQGKYGIDIREYYKTPNYKGPGKTGVRIPYEFLGQMRAFLEQMSVGLGISKEGNTVIPPKEVREECDNNPEGVPNDYRKFF